LKVALEPQRFEAYADAIAAAGGVVTELGPEVEALVWTDYADPESLSRTLDANPQLTWVQLPFAGVDAFAEIIQRPITFTSAKAAYAEPVAEHALMLCMALGRKIPERVRAVSWGKKYADSLYDEDVLIVGGGGIAEELVRLLKPFRSRVTVVRKRPDSLGFDDSVRVVGFGALDSELPAAKFVVLACALTDETRYLFNERRFDLMRNDGYLVNVARGLVVDQSALQQALETGKIAAAATDVTYPEPLPEQSPLWGLANLLITPHTADTMAIVSRLFAKRLHENVTARIAGKPLIGLVDAKLGY
jgi:phosphoglycerate dehydrogenase-like enzyme